MWVARPYLRKTDIRPSHNNFSLPEVFRDGESAFIAPCNRKCAKDLRAFARAALPAHLDALSSGALHSQNIARLWLHGRARRNGLSSRYSETLSPPLARPHESNPGQQLHWQSGNLSLFGKSERHRGSGKRIMIFPSIRCTKYIAKWKMFRSHFAQFKRLPGFGPFPAMLLPSPCFGGCEVHRTGVNMATDFSLRNSY